MGDRGFKWCERAGAAGAFCEATSGKSGNRMPRSGTVAGRSCAGGPIPGSPVFLICEWRGSDTADNASTSRYSNFAPKFLDLCLPEPRGAICWGSGTAQAARTSTPRLHDTRVRCHCRLDWLAVFLRILRIFARARGARGTWRNMSVVLASLRCWPACESSQIAHRSRAVESTESRRRGTYEISLRIPHKIEYSPLDFCSFSSPAAWSSWENLKIRESTA